jgi:hypothetical protein
LLPTLEPAASGPYDRYNARLMRQTATTTGKRWWVLVPIVALAAAFLPTSARTIEFWFSTSTYLHIQRVLTPISNVMPVAWLDVLSLAAATWLCWLWWHALRKDELPRWPRVRQAAVSTVTVAATLYIAFLLLWGFNYRRVRMTERLDLRPEPASTESAVRLARDTVSRLNGTYALAHNAGWPDPWRTAPLRNAFANVQQQLADAPLAVPGRLKHSIYGVFFRWTAVDGMVNPFGLEVLGNPDLLPFERPFVAAHEWAHLAGYADESEANFVGWLTCIHADPSSEYSGWLYLYWQITGELSKGDREAVARELREGPRADLSAIVARLRRGDLPMLREASWKVYDSYLKANRVDAGIRSYGEVVSLILRAKFENGWRPVRRGQPHAPIAASGTPMP